MKYAVLILVAFIGSCISVDGSLVNPAWLSPTNTNYSKSSHNNLINIVNRIMILLLDKDFKATDQIIDFKKLTKINGYSCR
jgi:hypothetical protein